MSRPLDFTGLTLALLRRLLYVWVRPTVLPDRPEALGLDPATPVCYVLDGRHLSNLLVLLAETRRAGLPRPRAAFAVGALRAKRADISYITNDGVGASTVAPSRAVATESSVISSSDPLPSSTS